MHFNRKEYSRSDGAGLHPFPRFSLTVWARGPSEGCKEKQVQIHVKRSLLGTLGEGGGVIESSARLWET